MCVPVIPRARQKETNQQTTATKTINVTKYGHYFGWMFGLGGFGVLLTIVYLTFEPATPLETHGSDMCVLCSAH